MAEQGLGARGTRHLAAALVLATLAGLAAAAGSRPTDAGATAPRADATRSDVARADVDRSDVDRSDVMGTAQDVDRAATLALLAPVDLRVDDPSVETPADDLPDDPPFDATVEHVTTDEASAPAPPRPEGPTDGTPVTADGAARRTAPPSRSLLVVLGGDVLNENAFNQAAADAAASMPGGARYAFGPLFDPPAAPVADILRSADLAVCHAELPIGAPGERPGVYGRSAFGGNLLLAPYELAPGLVDGGFDRCSTASNHSFDLGVPGIVSTLDAFDTVGISHVGTARNLEDALDDPVVEVNGIHIAHLSYTRSSNTVAPRDPWMLQRATSVEQVAVDVATLRAAGAELVIVSLHVGTEMQNAPTGGDRDFATRLTATADVDLLVHHGPHVVQPVERVNGTWVYWSLGNFVSGMGLAHQGRYADQRTLDGLLATVRFSELAPGVFTAESRPVLVCTSRSARTVHAPVAVLSDPVRAAAIDPARRAELQACLDRTRPVQPDLW
jgi:hypothetical protein